MGRLPDVIWKPIPSVPGYYAGSNGLIRGPRSPNGIKARETFGGYLGLSVVYSTSTLAKVVSKKVHVLVAEAWIGPRPKGLVIDHINHDNKDNRPENLRYMTLKENNQRRLYVKFGPKNLAKARRLYATGKYRQCDIGAMFGVRQQTVSRALKENLG